MLEVLVVSLIIGVSLRRFPQYRTWIELLSFVYVLWRIGTVTTQQREIEYPLVYVLTPLMSLLVVSAVLVALGYIFL